MEQAANSLLQCDSLEQFKRLLKTHHPFGPWDRFMTR